MSVDTSPDAGAAWLGLERTAENTWRLPVTREVVSGATALFGGCATAAALVVARALVEQPLIWATSHFGALAALGTTVDLTSRVVASGRTLTHLEVRGSFDGTDAFLVRAAAGDRPVVHVEGGWLPRVPVPAPDECAGFEHPVHADTWAARFEWRLAPTERSDGVAPVASWWVRPRAGEPVDRVVHAAVLVDYVTYGVGRALGVPMGGLSIDNVIRLHDLATPAGWFLLEVRPHAIRGGFGHGEARLHAGDALVAIGTQSIVVNGWDWRLPEEREGE